MSFPRYPKYKPSGVEWLGEVPAHWEVKQFRRCVYIAEGQVDPEDPQYASLPLIAPNHVESGTGRLLALESATEQGAESGKYLCEPGDVVYSKIRPALRKVCRAPERSLCSADMYPLRPLADLKADFLIWQMLGEQFSSYAILESQRVAMPKINRDSLSEVFLVVPPTAEQSLIAGFLEAETAKLDALIAEQERLIELLKEKRQAVISNAVTKGLSREVPMKDTCTPGIWSIPAHWTVAPLRRDLIFLTSGSRGWAEHYSDEGSLFLRIGNLTRDSLRVDLSDIQRVEVPDDAEAFRTRVEPGDLLFSITAFVGSVAVVPPSIESAYVSQHVALARLNRERLTAEWVGYVALSNSGKCWFETQSYGGTKIQLSLDDIRDFPIPRPPIEEQERIVRHIKREVTELTSLVSESEIIIQILRERRTALITAAVTGQIDVRSTSIEAVA